MIQSEIIMKIKEANYLQLKQIENAIYIYQNLLFDWELHEYTPDEIKNIIQEELNNYPSEDE